MTSILLVQARMVEMAGYEPQSKVGIIRESVVADALILKAFKQKALEQGWRYQKCLGKFGQLHS